MIEADLGDLIGPALASALEKKGYASLTPVQLAVLEPTLEHRDLRITSQTGSGKTVALGLAVADLVEGHEPSDDGVARPVVVVVTPTRELAKQVREELSWLFEPFEARVASVTGGAAYREELRALGGSPAVVVGTPGRLLDHLERGSIDVAGLAAIVLDEADRMLDLGFREELMAIFERLPEERRTHLVSATFPVEVIALADRFQSDPAHVEGTPLGRANLDIEHVVHVVDAKQRVDAVVNLLLARPEEQTLVFARTRADVARLTKELQAAGFAVASLSGEMEQAERNRALAAFKRGHQRVLVATDVAARGIDVAAVGRVIHVDPPTDSDSYTHRSGRTGRAGRKGTSVILVTPSAVRRTVAILRSLGLRHQFAPVPTADEIRHATDERYYEKLTAEDGPELDHRTRFLAERLLVAGNIDRTLGRLLVEAGYSGPSLPREVRIIDVLPEPGRAPHTLRPPAPRSERAPREWVTFHVTWGEAQGADPRRLLALVCRRGDIRGSDVGSIRISRSSSLVDVAAEVADAFRRNASRPDPRDPRVVIRPDRGSAREQAQEPGFQRARSGGGPRARTSDPGRGGDRDRAPDRGRGGDRDRAPERGRGGDRDRAPERGRGGDRDRAPERGRGGDRDRAPERGRSGDRERREPRGRVGAPPRDARTARELARGEGPTRGRSKPKR